MTEETDVADTVNLIRTIMVMGEKDAQHLVVMSSVDTLGVHAQIVGEISSQEKSRDFYFLSLAVFRSIFSRMRIFSNYFAVAVEQLALQTLLHVIGERKL